MSENDIVLKVRTKLGFDQQRMAYALGVSRRQIIRYEQGAWTPRSVILAARWLDEHRVLAKRLAQRDDS